MTVLLIGDWGGAESRVWREALQQALPDESLCEDARSLAPALRELIDVAVVANPVPGGLQDLPGLRLIQSLWAGVDRLLADPGLPAGVPLARMVDPAMNAAMAETALWAVLSLHRGFFRYARQQREGLWRVWPQRRADEVTVTVLGLGRMGSAVASRLAGQGYRVQGWRAGPGQPDDLPGVACTSGHPALPALLARTQVLINLLPLTRATRGLLDARLFAQLPRGAALVNLGRGAHLAENDLLDALASGQLAHAVLDVFQHEPLPAAHPFWQHPALTLLPHAAALTDPRSAAAVAAGNIRALRSGRPLAHLVDRQKGY